MKVRVCLLVCSVLVMGIVKSAAQAIKKELSAITVRADIPPFLYEGDRLEVAATITNTAAKEMTGQATLQLSDAATNTAVDGWFQNIFPTQYFTVAARSSEVVLFPIEVPYLFKNAVRWRVLARTETGADSISAVMSILTTKISRTESVSLPTTTGVHPITFDKLLRAGASTESHSLTVELFQNPMWHVVQALPCLAASDETAMQICNRMYAYAVAETLYTTMPQLKETIARWKTTGTASRQKNATAHGDLKNNLPEATHETEERIAALFDTEAWPAIRERNLKKLKSLQRTNGGFAWLGNAPADRFVTQCILTGIGHLKKLGTLAPIMDDINMIVKPALRFVDSSIAADYRAALKSKTALIKKSSPLHVHYLYARSFFTELEMPEATRAASRFYQQQAQQFWNGENPLLQGMTALALHRAGERKTPAVILQSVKQNTLRTKQKPRNASLQWWQDAVTEKAVLMEAFREITADTATVAMLQQTLLAEKGLSQWHTAYATAAASYALLLQPASRQDNRIRMQVRLGNTRFSNAGIDAAPSGYFRQTLVPPQVQPELGRMQISVQPADGEPVNTPASAAVYWRYFEEADSVPQQTFSNVHIRKQLFVKRAANTEPVHESAILHIGDTVTVRLTVTSKNELDYVQIRDGRAATMTFPDEKNEQQVRERNGYYQVNDSAGIQFLIPHLRKGLSTFEYTLQATRAGTFSTGAATVQSIYAPTVAARSKNMRIQVE